MSRSSPRKRSAATAPKSPKGNTQQHHDRHGPALILGRKHQENKHQRQTKNDGRQIAGFELLVGNIGPFRAEAFGQCRIRQLFHGFEGLAAAVARRIVAVDGNRLVHVVVGDVVGTGHGPGPDEGTQIDHIPVCVANLEPGDVGFIGSGLGLGLEIDPVDPAVLVELVDIQRSQVDLQGIEDIGN